MRHYLLALLLLPTFVKGQKSLDKYYSKLKEYREGRKDYSEMPYLAYTSKSIKDEPLANSIAQDYIENYLLNSGRQFKLSMGNIEFIKQFTQTSKDKGFELLFNHGEKVDQYIGNPGFSQNYIDYIIAKEDIDPKLWPNGNLNKPVRDPDWEEISTTIRKKYTEGYSERTVLNAKLRWYGFKNDSVNLAKYTIQKIERFGVDTVGYQRHVMNNDLYNYVFKHSRDKEELKKAIAFIEVLVKKEPNTASFLDTYANLLYKIGKTELALQIEEKAIKLAPSDHEIIQAWNKMKTGKPTW